MSWCVKSKYTLQQVESRNFYWEWAALVLVVGRKTFEFKIQMDFFLKFNKHSGTLLGTWLVKVEFPFSLIKFFSLQFIQTTKPSMPLLQRTCRESVKVFKK